MNLNPVIRLACRQVINNVAVGCSIGIWYAMPVHPMSTSAAIHANDTWLQSLRTQPLLRHANNVVHSNNNGLMVDRGVDADTGLADFSSDFNYDPKVNGVLIGATFEGVLAYKNYGVGVWIRGSILTVNNPVLIDNAIGAFMRTGASILLGATLEGQSPNLDPLSTAFDWSTLPVARPQYRVALQLYDFGMQLVKNSVARHFDDPSSRVLITEDRFGTFDSDFHAITRHCSWHRDHGAIDASGPRHCVVYFSSYHRTA